MFGSFRLDYDPEGLDSDDLATSLATLWTCLIDRICGSDRHVPQFTCYRPFFADANNPPAKNASTSSSTASKFFQRTYRYVRLCQLIWRYFASTGETDDARNCDRLVHDERAQCDRNDKRLFSFARSVGGTKSSPPHLRPQKDEKSKVALYWQLVANLVRAVKLHLPTGEHNRNELLCAARICNELLQLIFLLLTTRRQPVDVLSFVSTKRKHELIAWLYALAANKLVADAPTAAAVDLGSTFYRLLSHLTAQSATNAHLMRALALDIYNYRHQTNDARGIC